MNQRRNIHVGAGLMAACVLFVAATAVFGQAAIQSSASVATGLMATPNIVVQPNSPQNLALADAVQDGNFAVVQSLLAQGASPDILVGWENEPVKTPLAIWAERVADGIDHAGARGKIADLLLITAQNHDASDGRTGETLLMAAAEMGDFRAVKRLVEAGADVNARTNVQNDGQIVSLGQPSRPNLEGGETPLDFALNNGRAWNARSASVPLAIKYLIDHGSNVNAQEATGYTPLMAAAQFGRTSVVKMLLAHGANPALRNGGGATALDFADMHNHSDIIDILIPLARMTMDIYEAASYGETDQVKRCVDAGADVNALDFQGQTPLIRAAVSGSFPTVKLLLERGARVNGVGKTGSTPLQVAAFRGHTAVVKLLIHCGADVNRGNMSGGESRAVIQHTPLEEAVDGSQPDAVAVLLANHVDLNLFDQGNECLETAVNRAGVAFQRRHSDLHNKGRTAEDDLLSDEWKVINELLNCGVSASANHSHCLYTAAYCGQAEIVGLLLNHGAKINDQGGLEPGPRKQDQTALMGSIENYGVQGGEGLVTNPSMIIVADPSEVAEARSQALETIKVLLAHHADVNVRTPGGLTPVMQCVEFDLPSLAGQIVARGADTNESDNAGFTPLTCAAARCDLAMARLLLSHGAAATINHRNEFGYTALMLTCYASPPIPDPDQCNGPENESISSAGPDDLPRELINHYRDSESSESARVAMAKLLLSHNADVTLRARDGGTALSLATTNGLKALAQTIAMAGVRRRGYH